MTVSFGGIGEMVITFYNDATYKASAGDPVNMTDDGEVGKTAASGRFIGVAITADDDFAAVQTAGYIVMPYTGDTAPSVGYTHLISNGSGGVKVDAGTEGVYTGAEYLVIDVDTTAKKVGFII